ncbi:hypothetical protein [Desertivirga xinjiangensis]|uniref:hypothetical protein n=1 Tax=Desertivirga xinjiangensis TaxID=539206 RepID=UPI00210B843B|nr:hypothetical protein [Pedobacter xinjiangensis]
MAGWKLKEEAGGKLKASTLLEVIVSMIMIMIIFAIATGIVTNISRRSVSLKEIKAMSTLTFFLAKCESAPFITEQTFNYADFIVKRKVLKYRGDDRLREVRVVIYNEDEQKLAEGRKIVYVQ